MKIGFLVNPIAGMGGPLGLKGTDGAELQKLAVARGGRRLSPERSVEALTSIAQRGVEAEFLTCAGDMGANELAASGIDHKVVYHPRDVTTALDTKRAARIFLQQGVDLILFAGGDGTARDLTDEVDAKVPILGIPAGVKMHSGVFALRPGEVGDILEQYAESGATREAEVMDVDEEAYRDGILQAKLYAVASVPDDKILVQSAKNVYRSGSARDEVEELGQYVAELLKKGTMYILGPGSTVAAVLENIGEKKTALGVDVLLDGRIVAVDADEKKLLETVPDANEVVVIVAPIGSQGFIFGRGNQQISPKVLASVENRDIWVIATPTKLADTPTLKVDTGNHELDKRLRGRIKVITGYKRRRLVEVV